MKHVIIRTFVLRFVDSDFVIHCKRGLAGLGLANLISNAINDLGVDMKNCRGQGYDGAGSVSRHIKGLLSGVLSINRKALYVNSHSHRLNLCVCNS